MTSALAIPRAAPTQRTAPGTDVHAVQPRFLEAAPYVEAEHLLDLASIDMPYRLMAVALMELEPATDAYATAPYADAFNWAAVMARVRQLAADEQSSWKATDFYVVDFRSRLQAVIDCERIFRLDKEAHREATASGGLLKYWYGTPDKQRRNLATCVWRCKEDAVAGGKGPWHKQARACVRDMYEAIDVSGVRLTVHDGAEGWTFTRHP